jgi:dTDP-4-dehydrorhamnose 3,5-epimerase
MRFTETPLAGAFVIDLERREDERGFFARTFCRREFEAHGLSTAVVQGNTSCNHRRGTLRGMHWQAEPAAEPKVVRSTCGAVHDVIVDLRPGSPTYLRHFAIELSQENGRSLYVPPLFAHGYLTLTDGAEVSYLVGEYHAPGTERGLRFDDPALGIVWPIPVAVISDKDRAWPLLDAGVPAPTGAPAGGTR